MLLLRIGGLLVALFVGGAIIAWLLTNNRAYLYLALRVAKVALMLAFAVFLLMAAERLIIL